MAGSWADGNSWAAGNSWSAGTSWAAGTSWSGQEATSVDPIAAAHAVIAALSPIAVFRFNDGASTQLTDYSGNNNHGTLGSGVNTPTWVASPASLSFATNDKVTTPELASVAGIDVVFKSDVDINAAATAAQLMGHSFSGIRLGAASASFTNEIICIRQDAAAGYPANRGTAWVHASDAVAADGWHLLQCDTRAGSPYWTIRLDGTNKATNQVNTPAAFLAAVWTIGIGGDGATNPFNGDIAYIVMYGSSRDDATQAACRDAIATIMNDRGIVLPFP